MEYSISLSIYIYESWPVGKGGLNYGVAYQEDDFSNKYEPCSNINREASGF